MKKLTKTLAKNAMILIPAAALLAACSGEPDVEVSQAGYDEAKDCFAATMAMSAIGKQTGGKEYRGSNKAMTVMATIGTEIGIDAQKQREDLHQSSQDIQEMMKLEPGSAEFTDLETRAQACTDKFDSPF